MRDEDRSQAVSMAKTYLQQKPVYIDTETTGVKEFDVIVEVAVVDWDGSTLYESLVKPNKPIPPDATRVHGITDAKVAFSPLWAQVWSELTEVLAGRVIGFYNAAFDLKMMRQSCGLNGIRWDPQYSGTFCVMELFAQYYGEWNAQYGKYRWKNLTFAGQYFKIPEQNTHRAKDDALLTKLVLEKMAQG